MSQNAATFAQLKAAVEDTTTTEITLTADITFTAGIKVPTGKKQLTIDCDGHTVTEKVSTAYADGLYIPAGAQDVAVTVKNAVWNGYNYYGVVCVVDDAANAGATITLQNISYVGPQMIYNRYGTTVVDNCTVKIMRNGSSVASHEMGEVNSIVFAGMADVTSATTSNAVLWFPFAGAALTVQNGATVTINAPDTYLIYSDMAAKPTLNFQSNSVTEINAKSGLFYTTGTGAHIASHCTVGTKATLKVTATTNNGTPLLKCVDGLTVQNGATLSLVMLQSGTAPLVYCSAVAKVTFDQPQSILLYSSAGKVFSFAAGTTANPNAVTFTSRQANYWAKSTTPFAQAGGFDDIPTVKLYRQNDNHLTVTQTTTSSAVVATTSNMQEGDVGYPIGSAFNLLSAAVLSVGALPLTIDKINDLSLSISGTTLPNANVRVTTPAETLVTTADDSGNFSVALLSRLTAEQTVQVAANKNFLTTEAEAVVGGSVSVTNLPDIPFNAIGSPRNNAVLKRLNANWQLQLTDTRKGGGNWALYVSVAEPLQSSDAVIDNAVTFVEQGKTALTTSPRL